MNGTVFSVVLTVVLMFYQFESSKNCLQFTFVVDWKWSTEADFYGQLQISKLISNKNVKGGTSK